jgi:hypothetical protein
MVRQILGFRASLIAGGAILAGASLMLSPMSASAAQATHTLAAARSAPDQSDYQFENAYNGECLDGREADAGGVAVQECYGDTY